MRRFDSSFPRLAAVFVLWAGLGAGTMAMAHDFHAGTLDIGHPWTRSTVAGQPAGGGFLTVRNTGPAADRLVGAASPAAAEVQMHTMSMEGDVMRMRQVDGIDLPAGQTVALEPGHLHLMLIGLKAPLKAGDMVPLTLRFEKAGEVPVQLKVESAGAAPASASGMGGMEGHHHH